MWRLDFRHFAVIESKSFDIYFIEPWFPLLISIFGRLILIFLEANVSLQEMIS